MNRPIINGKITTMTGRMIPVYPRRGSLNAIKQWLAEQSIAESKARHDDFNGPMFERMDFKRLSPADQDTMNDYLFGETYPRFSEVME